jgi:hypothetical protein
VFALLLLGHWIAATVFAALGLLVVAAWLWEEPAAA